MDDSILMPEMDKAMLVIRNYVEILENKVVELGTENKDLKVELHNLHNEIELLKKELEKKSFSGYYKDIPEWSGGFLKRVEKSEDERRKAFNQSWEERYGEWT